MASKSANQDSEMDSDPSPVKKPPSKRGLTARQRGFVREYLIDLNATAAYKRAGYKGQGRTAENNACRMLGNAGVQAAIQAALAKAEERSAATIERIELQLERIALADIRKLFRPDGTLKSPGEWDDETAAAVGSIEVHEEITGKGKDKRVSGYLKKVKCWEMVKALVELLKRRDLAGKGPLGSHDNPIHQRITFIEFADTDQTQVPTADAGGGAQRPEGHPLDAPPGTAPRP
jgi:phage terminase small subunit